LRILFVILLAFLIAGIFNTPGASAVSRPPAPVQYLSPLPGAAMVSRESSITVRFLHGSSAFDLDPSVMFVVAGSQSGEHYGSVVISDDTQTAVFKPDVPFEPGERVRITIRYRQPEAAQKNSTDGAIGAVVSDFVVSPNTTPQQPRPLSWFREFFGDPPRRNPSTRPRAVDTGTAAYSPPLDFPPITIDHVDNPGEGYVFLTNYLWQWNPYPRSYLMILRNDGTPFFFRKSPTFALDFKKQNDELLTYFEFSAYAYIFLDSTYTLTESCRCGHGYTVDPHDLNVLDNGHVLIMCQDEQTVDMSQIVPGGQPDAKVVGMIYQELDLARDVVFEWRTWDHFQITDAIGVDFTADRIDYVHSNALVLDNDGNWLVSHRHLSEITKINRTTGDIIWRLGGKNNQFEFVNDINDSTGFNYQHDIRAMENGNYLLYDNGNFHSPPFSRAVEYQLDVPNKTATVTWQYRDTPDIYGWFMGSAQRLPGGNTFISWGGTYENSAPTITEVHPDGSKAFELTIEDTTLTYRAFRFPWSGTAPKPELWPGEFDKGSRTLTLNFDKFGDQNVDHYLVYRGRETGGFSEWDTTSANTIDVPGIENDILNYFRVRAVYASGQMSIYSDQVSFKYTAPPAVRLIGPADGALVETAAVVLSWTRPDITSPDTLSYSVSILGDPATRIDGIADTFYVYQGPVDKPRDGFRWTVSSDNGSYFTPSPDTFSVWSSRAGFGTPVLAALHQNYPNPFNPGTTIRYDVPANGPVTITVYNVAGQEVVSLVNDTRPAGFWVVNWDGSNRNGTPVASGVYFYKMEVATSILTRKMVFIQ
jgi:hypothetical protein